MISTLLDRNALLDGIAQALDIPPTLDARARQEYHRLGTYLCADPVIGKYAPQIYPQGSFRLGTVIQPIVRSDGYDIDNVCRLSIQKELVTQQQLKALVGDALERSDRYRPMLKEGRRCWTLVFSEGFHIDVLPAIPNMERVPDGILITDKELFRWQWSNPIGYAAWFRNQQAAIWQAQREYLARAQGGSVDQVPDHEVKTPLQRAVQLMKRHRDVMFAAAPDDKPISIIITTLAARSYNSSPDLASALRHMVAGMPQHIEQRQGRFWIENPVEAGENFADKWQQYPERERAFRRWHTQLVKDVEEMLGARSTALSETLTRQFGKDVAQEALIKLGHRAQTGAQSGYLQTLTGTGALGLGTQAAAQSIIVPRHHFYGADETPET